MTQKTKSPPDPGAELQEILEQIQDEIVRSEASIPSFEDNANKARAAKDSDAVAMAMAGLSGAYMALDRLRAEEQRIKAELAPYERAKAEATAVKHIVKYLSAAGAARARYEAPIAKGAAAIQAAAEEAHPFRREVFAAIGGALREAQDIGVMLKSYRQEDRPAKDALLHKIAEAGGDVSYLDGSPGSPPSGWQNRKIPELGAIIERVVDSIANEQAQAETGAQNLEQERRVREMQAAREDSHAA